MAEALLALGGNVGDVRSTLDRAVAALCDGAELRLVARSSDYRTPPWGVEDQPPFINCAIVAATDLAPPALLDRAQRIERQFGRDRPRERRWGPRPLDIDLIAYDDVTLDTPELTLPHPACSSAPLCWSRWPRSRHSGGSRARASSMPWPRSIRQGSRSYRRGNGRYFFLNPYSAHRLSTKSQSCFSGLTIGG